MTSFDEFVAGYVTCALWTEELDGKYSKDDFSESSMAKITEDCQKFFNENFYMWDTVDSGTEEFTIHELAGHDLWLTRNGHGAGFWDRPKIYGQANSELLSIEARKFSNRNVYIGDDGKLEIE